MQSQGNLNLAAGLLHLTHQDVDTAVDKFRKIKPKVTPKRARRLIRNVEERMAAGDFPIATKATPHRSTKVPHDIMMKAVKVLRKGFKQGGKKAVCLSYKAVSVASAPAAVAPLTSPPTLPQAVARSPALQLIIEKYGVTAEYIWRHARKLDPTLGMITLRPKMPLDERVKAERLGFAKRVLKMDARLISNAYFGDEAKFEVKVKPFRTVGCTTDMDVVEDPRCNPGIRFPGILSYFMAVQRGVGIAYLGRLTCSKGLKPFRRKYHASITVRYPFFYMRRCIGQSLCSSFGPASWPPLAAAPSLLCPNSAAGRVPRRAPELPHLCRHPGSVGPRGAGHGTPRGGAARRPPPPVAAPPLPTPT